MSADISLTGTGREPLSKHGLLSFNTGWKRSWIFHTFQSHVRRCRGGCRRRADRACRQIRPAFCPSFCRVSLLGLFSAPRAVCWVPAAFHIQCFENIFLGKLGLLPTGTAKGIYSVISVCVCVCVFCFLIDLEEIDESAADRERKIFTKTFWTLLCPAKRSPGPFITD